MFVFLVSTKWHKTYSEKLAFQTIRVSTGGREAFSRACNRMSEQNGISHSGLQCLSCKNCFAMLTNSFFMIDTFLFFFLILLDIS